MIAARTITRQGFDDRYGDRFLTLPLDVTDRDAVFTVTNAAIEHFGRLDIVVNRTDLYTSTTTTPSAEQGPLRAELEKQWAEGSIDSEQRLAAEALPKLVDSEDRRYGCCSAAGSAIRAWTGSGTGPGADASAGSPQASALVSSRW